MSRQFGLGGQYNSELPCPDKYLDAVHGRDISRDALTKGHVIQGTRDPRDVSLDKEFTTMYLTRFRTYKNCFATPNKNLGGERASDR